MWIKHWVNFQRAFEDSQRWAATDRVGQTVRGARCCDAEGAVLRPLLYVASPARWDRPMTRSAGDAVIPHSRPVRWRSAGSSVRTRVRTGRPVRTVCTGCWNVCAASGGPQGADWCGRVAAHLVNITEYYAVAMRTYVKLLWPLINCLIKAEWLRNVI